MGSLSGYKLANFILQPFPVVPIVANSHSLLEGRAFGRHQTYMLTGTPLDHTSFHHKFGLIDSSFSCGRKITRTTGWSEGAVANKLLVRVKPEDKTKG
jgi:hypothetical protein